MGKWRSYNLFPVVWNYDVKTRATNFCLRYLIMPINFRQKNQNYALLLSYLLKISSILLFNKIY